MLTKFVTLIYVKPDHSANNERDERRNGSSAAAVLREMKVGKGLVLKSPTNLLAVMTAVNAADQDRFSDRTKSPACCVPAPGGFCGWWKLKLPVRAAAWPRFTPAN
jgi:hypothetical protein